MRIITFFTPSHRVLFDQYLVPSIPRDLVLGFKECPQECRTGEYGSEGWTSTTLRKVRFIIGSIQESWGETFIYTDVDAQFFGDVVECARDVMEGRDIMFQRDSPSGDICAGFFICRACDSTLNLWKETEKIMLSDARVSDQPALKYLLGSKKGTIASGVLPPVFYGPGAFHGFPGYRWTSGSLLHVPKGILYHHANWTIGVRSKVEQLNYVRGIVKKGGGIP